MVSEHKTIYSKLLHFELKTVAIYRDGLSDRVQM